MRQVWARYQDHPEAFNGAQLQPMASCALAARSPHHIPSCSTAISTITDRSVIPCPYQCWFLLATIVAPKSAMPTARKTSSADAKCDRFFSAGHDQWLVRAESSMEADPRFRDTSRARTDNPGNLRQGWEKVEAQCRDILAGACNWFPIFVRLSQNIAANGSPPFRALLMDYPDDPALAIVDDEYLIGDRIGELLSLPGEAQRTVVLPKGDWHDLWTGAPVAGGREVAVDRRYP